MNTAVARRINGQTIPEWKPVPVEDDAQLQKCLREGWTIDQAGERQIKLSKPGSNGHTKTMTHHRRRAK